MKRHKWIIFQFFFAFIWASFPTLNSYANISNRKVKNAIVESAVTFELTAWNLKRKSWKTMNHGKLTLDCRFDSRSKARRRREGREKRSFVKLVAWTWSSVPITRWTNDFVFSTPRTFVSILVIIARQMIHLTCTYTIHCCCCCSCYAWNKWS